MPKAIFIDTTRCTACRGCQVACKEWHGHPAVPTKQRGSHQNPPDLTPYNYKLVRFSEHLIDDRVHWLFFPEQCRHCLQPACKATADLYVEGAIIQDETTGIVVCTDKTKELTAEQAQEVIDSCPYNVPRRDEKTGTLNKCDMCIDRVKAGMVPMCVKSCCTGTMSFGEREDMLKLAKERLEKVKAEFPYAGLEKVLHCDADNICTLLDAEDLGVIYLVSLPRELYHQYARRKAEPLTRADFLAGLTRPLRSLIG
jgi:formate dehydrogenase iron-sulfur subunit